MLGRMPLVDLEDAMRSSSQTGDELNGSFRPAYPDFQDLKPGVEPSAQEQEAAEEGHPRRRPADDYYETRGSLAERIREREAR